MKRHCGIGSVSEADTILLDILSGAAALALVQITYDLSCNAKDGWVMKIHVLNVIFWLLVAYVWSSWLY